MFGFLKKNQKSKIFVQIASYRDPECQWTVKDLFNKAEHPDRISVGICWQYSKENDRDCFKEPSPYPGQTRIIETTPQQSKGVCWARAQAQTLYQGEGYVLMIDSHMRFITGWDSALITELERCEADKPYISCYPPGYTPPDRLAQNPHPNILRAKDFNSSGDIRFDGESLPTKPDKPLKGAFLAAGFLFADGNFISDIPYDPFLYFDNEEICLAARAYTKGWDVFHSPETFLYHYYHKPSDNKEGKEKKLHWNENKDWKHMRKTSQARYNYLLCRKMPDSAPEALTEIEKYGLGKKRSLEEFEDYCGIDFVRKTVSEKAKRALFIENINHYRRQTS